MEYVKAGGTHGIILTSIKAKKQDTHKKDNQVTGSGIGICKPSVCFVP